VAVSLGGMAAAAAWAVHQPSIPEFPSDWDEIWAAGRALLLGQEPYSAMQLAYEAGEFKYPLIYPGTAVILALPFAVFPLPVALGIWSGIGIGGLSWVLTRRGWWGLLGLFSMPIFYAFFLVQWSPLITAAVAIPWLGLVWAAKPTIGAAFLLSYPSRPAVLGSVLLLALSFVLIPHWPAAMAQGLRTAPHLLPLIFRPGGLLLLLAFLRWRLPEGRLLGLLALVPQTTLIYDMVPLLLIPRTWREMATLVAFSIVAFFAAGDLRPIPLDTTDFPVLTANYWPFWFLGGYLPALVMLLRSCPITRTEAKVVTLVGLLVGLLTLLFSGETTFWSSERPIGIGELPYHLGLGFRFLPPLGVMIFGLVNWIRAEG
jgi:hypothetical protein